MAQSKREHFRLNAPGDFYVENGLCLLCLTPEHEAPALMGFHQDPRPGRNADSHCYFARQPSTPDETYRAIRAVWVGCCDALRYRGTDPQVIQRLVDLGLDTQVDALGSHTEPRPPRRPRVIRNHVAFMVEGEVGDLCSLAKVIGTAIVGTGLSSGSITEVKAQAKSALLTYRWSSRAKGIELSVQRSAETGNGWLLVVGTGDHSSEPVSMALLVDDALRTLDLVRNIRWYTGSDWNAGRTAGTPVPC